MCVIIGCSYKRYAMLPQLFDMENVFTVSSDPQSPPAAPPSLSIPLSSSSTSSGTKKQKKTPTYQRSVSQESSNQLVLLCVKHGFWRSLSLVEMPTNSLCSFHNHFFHIEF